jgi:predicted RNase H-like HicB family nuclease
MRHSIKAFVHKGESYYVAECMEIAVVTQGKTLDETMTNLQEAVALQLEGENLADFDLASNPSLLVTFELEPAVVT